MDTDQNSKQPLPQVEFLSVSQLSDVELQIARHELRQIFDLLAERGRRFRAKLESDANKSQDMDSNSKEQTSLPLTTLPGSTATDSQEPKDQQVNLPTVGIVRKDSEEQ